MMRCCFHVVAVLIGFAGIGFGSCAGQAQAPTVPTVKSELPEEQLQFIRQLEGSTLVGCFTANDETANSDSKEGGTADSPKKSNAAYDLKEERYEIRRVKKLDKEDFWIIQARIQYGERDITLPVPVRVQWAGQTPVITLDKVTIPGMGTFDARVVIHDGKYAGTWRHDQISGHLFGTVEKKQPFTGSQ